MLSFDALADPARRRIIEMLVGGEMTVGDIAGRFEMSQPAVSQHLAKLRRARLVRVRAASRNRFYSIDPRGLREVDAWLARTRKFWAHRLDALDRELRSISTHNGE